MAAHRRSTHGSTRRCAIGAAVLLLAACGGERTPLVRDGGPDRDDGGGDDDDDVIGGGPPDAGVEPLWDELGDPIAQLAGGAALATADPAIGAGGAGGALELHAAGELVFAPGVGPGAPPVIPAAAAEGATLATADLDHDVARDGTIVIRDVVETGGAGTVRTIEARSGDLVVAGTLRAGRFAGGRQGLILRAPGGTVSIDGGVVTGGIGPGAGPDAGAIRIEARQVIVRGAIVAAGAEIDDAPGGAGGAVTIVASHGPIVVRGAIDASGAIGDEAGGAAGAITLQAGGGVYLSGELAAVGGDADVGIDAVGGAAGGLAILAGGDVSVLGRVRLRGGAARAIRRASGGAAGTLRLDTPGVARITGTLDLRGGHARGGDDAIGGAGGAVRIGATTRPATIALRTPVRASGGRGGATGGAGGGLALEARAGELHLGVTIALGGGAARGRPGDAGACDVAIGPHGGGLVVVGRLASVGGSIEAGGAGAGGAGGAVTVRITSPVGGVVVAAGGGIVADGGAGAGAGLGGDGGMVTLRAYDGDAAIAGDLIARGGAGGLAGGTGGRGGGLDLLTDDDHDGEGGDLSIEPTGLIDVSGGPGPLGGDARNDGAWGVADFPNDDESIAVLLNSDGMHGSPRDGQLRNLGRIVARGGAAGGAGGDVMFHGRQFGNDDDPLRGDVQVDGDGGGMPGSWVPE
jgi:hypothetical protein